MKKARCLLILLLLSAHGLMAQTATGAWYGKAEVEVPGMHDNYLTELVIKQKGNRVEGTFGYYFRDKYQSFVVHGSYNPRTREVTILNIPVIYYGSNSTVNSIDCNTNFRATLINSKIKSSLKGYFYHDERYAHMCPDLKVNYTLDRDEKKQDSLAGAPPVVARIWTPQADDYVVDAAPASPAIPPPSAATSPATAAANPVAIPATIADSLNRKPDSARMKPDSATVRPDSLKSSGAARPDASLAMRDSSQVRPDSSRAAAPIAAVTAPGKPLVHADSAQIVQSFTKRKPTLNKILDIESDSIRVSFYDNGEIDGDSISVFVNQQLVLRHQELAARALVLYLRLDSARETNEISMFAENLGKYPPNTALMVVTDGKNRYEVFMSSSLTENATIQLRRKRTP